MKIIIYKICDVKINSIFLLVSFFITLLFISSCGKMVEEIEWETKNISKKLIVDGNISTQLSTHPIKLKTSDDYFSNKPNPNVLGAQIIVSSSDGDVTYIEDTENPGMYEASNPFQGKSGLSYTLKINLAQPVDGIYYYEATTEIIEGMPIDSIQAFLYNNPDKGVFGDSLLIVAVLYGLEPAQIENYYMTRIYKNGELLTDSVLNYSHFRDKDYGFNGDSIFYMVFYDAFEPDDIFSIDLISIPKDYEYFLTGLDQISQPEDVFGFSGPPANAIGNVNKGNALGFYYGAFIQSGSTQVLDQTNEYLY